MKRLVYAMAIGVSLLLPSAALADSEVNVNVAYHPNMHGGGIMAIATDQGYFKDEGLKVNAVRFTSGAPELDAMIAGQLDIGYLGPGAMPVVMRGDVQLLTVDHPDSNERIIASKDSGVADAKGLKGQHILFATGTTGEFVVRAALSSVGLAMSDISAVNSPDEIATTAYISGQVNVISVGPTFSNQALLQRPSNVVFNSNSYKGFSLPGFWIANKKFVKDHPDVVARFLRAFGRADDYRAAHLGTIVPLVQKYTQTPAAILQDQVDLTSWWTLKETNKAIADGSVADMLKQLNEMFRETGKLTQIAPIDSYFDGKATLAAYEGAK